MRTTLLITCLNEVEGMKVILPRIQKKWVDEIIVLDGNSTDGSAEFAESLGFKVIRQRTKGLMNAYWEGIEAATSDVIIPFSPDGNSVPERIPDLVAKVKEGYDMVIVSRYLNGARSEDDTLLTAFGNWMFTKLINMLFGGHYTDALVLFRAWKTDLLRSVPTPISARVGYEPLLAIHCAKKKMRVAEIPGDEPKRIAGSGKTNPFMSGFAILQHLVLEKLR